MYSELNTEDIVKSRMLGNVSSDLDKREGSFIYDSVSPAAIEIAQGYIDLDQVLVEGFAETSDGTYLRMRAHEHGVIEKEATKATGYGAGLITGTPGYTVAASSVFSTASGVEFAIMSPVVISDNGQATADIEAVEAGSQGNVPAGVINLISKSIPGVTSFTNIKETSGGSDPESDADLLVRLLEKVKNPATNGNKSQYEQWTRDIEGVGDCKVIPIGNGPGTVKILITDINKLPASPELVTTVQNVLDPNQNGDGEGVAPIGATVYVESVDSLAINVSATLKVNSAYTLAQAQASFETVLNDYLKSISLQVDDQKQPLPVSYAMIGSKLIGMPEVDDHSNLLLNGGVVNIPVPEDSVPVKGTVSLS